METIRGSKLFKGGNYMKKYGIFFHFEIPNLKAKT